MQNAKQTTAKPFNATGWNIGIVVADFNHDITSQLLASAVERASHYGIDAKNIQIVHVAGAVEVPLVLQKMAQLGAYNVLLAVGCVIEGETPHFDYVCKFVTEGVLRVQLDHTQPIGFGVLTCHNHAEATSRAHLGAEHIDAALHQAKALKNLC